MTKRRVRFVRAFIAGSLLTVVGFVLVANGEPELRSDLPIIWQSENLTVAEADGAGHVLGVVKVQVMPKAAIIDARTGQVILRTDRTIGYGSPTTGPGYATALPGGGFAWVSHNRIRVWKPGGEAWPLIAPGYNFDTVYARLRLDGRELKWTRYHYYPDGGESGPPDFWKADLSTEAVTPRKREPDDAPREQLLKKAPPEYGLPTDAFVRSIVSRGDLVVVEWSRDRRVDLGVIRRSAEVDGVTVLRREDATLRTIGEVSVCRTAMSIFGRWHGRPVGEGITGFAVDAVAGRLYVSRRGKTIAYSLGE